MPKPFRIEVLGKNHDLSSFSSGDVGLDRYLQQIAHQDAKRRVATVFVLVDAVEDQVAGFYSLSSLSIQLADLPRDVRQRLPRYPAVPAVLLGRLARDLRYKGRGCGELLLLDALQRAWRATSQVAAFAVVVDAENEQAQAFYRRYDFQALQDRPTRLFLPLRTVEHLLSQNENRAP